MNKSGHAFTKYGKGRLLFAAITLLVLSGFTFYKNFTKQQIHGVSDLRTIQGKVSSHAFWEGSRGRQYYYIYLKECSDRFQIPADFLTGFDRRDFESKVHKGDGLKIYFNKELWVFAMEDGARTYLSADYTIQKYNYSDIEMGFILFVFSAICFVLYFNHEGLTHFGHERLAPFFLKRLSPVGAAILTAVLLIAIIWWLSTYFNL